MNTENAAGQLFLQPALYSSPPFSSSPCGHVRRIRLCDLTSLKHKPFWARSLQHVYASWLYTCILLIFVYVTRVKNEVLSTTLKFQPTLNGWNRPSIFLMSPGLSLAKSIDPFIQVKRKKKKVDWCLKKVNVSKGRKELFLLNCCNIVKHVRETPTNYDK